MAAQLLRLDHENPSPKQLQQAVDVLEAGGIIIYPTDTIYGVGCDMFNQKAVEKLCNFKEVSPKNAKFSFICQDLSELSEYTKQLSNSQFKMLKRALPGPYTFILSASGKIPKILHNKRKTVGIRIPNNPIPTELVRMLGRPILTTSVKDDDEVIEYNTDPDLIFDTYKEDVDMVINGGYGNNIPSTIIDYSGEDYEIIREGLGPIEDII